VRAVGVSRYGVVPEASLGARLALSEPLSFFARAGLSRHFPSMLNRFYTYPSFPGYPGFVGNPGLQPEEDWTGTLGIEYKGREMQAGLQAYGQFAQDAQVVAPYDSQNNTEVNSGNARVASLLGHVAWSALAWLDLGASVTVAQSQLSANGYSFPGQPAGLGVFSVGVHSVGEVAGGAHLAHLWDLRVYERLSTDAAADAVGNRLPAYHEEDVELRARIGAGWLAMARLEDVTNQQPQLVYGYPSFGRTLSVLVSREL